MKWTRAYPRWEQVWGISRQRFEPPPINWFVHQAHLNLHYCRGSKWKGLDKILLWIYIISTWVIFPEISNIFGCLVENLRVKIPIMKSNQAGRGNQSGGSPISSVIAFDQENWKCISLWIISALNSINQQMIHQIVNVQGIFFKSTPPEFAKCWPVSNRFQKKR